MTSRIEEARLRRDEAYKRWAWAKRSGELLGAQASLLLSAQWSWAAWQELAGGPDAAPQS